MNPILKFLLHPMVAMSLLLHGLVLALPTPDPPQAEPEEKPVEEVQISNISSLKVAPQPSPILIAPTPKPIPKPSVQAVLLPRPQPPLPRPVPTPTPVATPTPAATPNPVATPTPTATPTPVATATPSPEPPLSEATLQSSSVGAGQASAAQYYYAFPDPAAFFDPASLEQADSSGSDPVPLNGVTNMSRLERIGLNQAKAEYLPLLYPGGTFTPAGSYGGGEVYEVRKDNAVGYVVLLEEDGIGLATFVVEWNHNPALPAKTPAVGGVPAQ